MPTIVPPPTIVPVPVVSAWWSKINWTQVMSVGVMLATMAGVIVPSDVQRDVLAAIIAVQAAVTIVLKTFFTTSVTPASAVKVST